MRRTGIPKRFQRAHLSTCERYADEPGKQRALELATEFARERRLVQRDRTRFCLLLSGDFGTGKTWLGTAVFQELIWSGNRQGLWRKFHSFIREVQGTYSAAARRSVDEVLGAFQKTPVLMLDDVGDLTQKVQTDDRRRLLYEVIDARNDQLLPTIITTNLDEQQLTQQFGARTFERLLEMAALVGMTGKNLRIED